MTCLRCRTPIANIIGPPICSGCLSDYLLGSEHAGPGLLNRVRDRIEALSELLGPRYRTGWYIPTHGSGASENETEEGQVEALTDLACALVEWQGRGFGTSSTQAKNKFLAYLRSNKLTDVDYLLGTDKIREEGEAWNGKLAYIRTEVRDLLKPDPAPLQDHLRCLSLMEFLKAWIGPCEHQWRALPSDDSKIVVMRCVNCNAGYSNYLGDDAWLAVGG